MQSTKLWQLFRGCISFTFGASKAWRLGGVLPDLRGGGVNPGALLHLLEVHVSPLRPRPLRLGSFPLEPVSVDPGYGPSLESEIYGSSGFVPQNL